MPVWVLVWRRDARPGMEPRAFRFVRFDSLDWGSLILAMVAFTVA